MVSKNNMARFIQWIFIIYRQSLTAINYWLSITLILLCTILIFRAHFLSYVYIFTNINILRVKKRNSNDFEYHFAKCKHVLFYIMRLRDEGKQVIHPCFIYHTYCIRKMLIFKGFDKVIFRSLKDWNENLICSKIVSLLPKT